MTSDPFIYRANNNNIVASWPKLCFDLIFVYPGADIFIDYQRTYYPIGQSSWIRDDVIVDLISYLNNCHKIGFYLITVLLLTDTVFPIGVCCEAEGRGE